MLKVLLKIRLRALADSVLSRRRGKKNAGKGMKALLIFLLIYCVAVFGGMFGMMFYGMYEPFSMLDMGWLYYAMAGVLGTMLCFVGSVFFTQSVLFEAKDNELLLSMPVRPSAILGSRVALLLLINYGFSLLLTLPCGVVRCIVAPFTVWGVVRYVLCALLLPLLPTAISCVVGWLIALIISRMRNKTFFTLAVSMAFMGAYFTVCFNLQSYIEKMIENGAAIGTAIRRALPPFYAMGVALETGALWPFVQFVLWCVVPFAVIYALLSRSFIHIATMKRGQRKVRYEARALRASSVRWALTKKELRRLTNSSAYMLNGCMGAVMSVALAVLCVAKGSDLMQGLARIYAGGMDVSRYVVPMACLLECFTMVMNVVSAPSVSLEGKNLWTLQSAPLRAGDVLISKALVHMIVCVPAALVSSLLFSVALSMTPAEIAFMFLLPLVLTVFMALLGVAVNLRWPRFDYTSETAVIKQSASVTITMFGGMGLVLLPLLLYIFLLKKVMDVQLMLLVCTALLAIGAAVLYDYLAHRAERAFANLNQG